MKKLLLKLKSLLGCVYRGIQEAGKSRDSRLRTRYAYYYKFCRVKENLVLYESFYGRGMVGDPYALFNALYCDPAHRDLQHIWAVKEEADLLLSKKYGNNVRFVRCGSKEYLKSLCTAKYLINNSTFGTYFVKKPEQIYVNTWHGIPLKTLGYDMPDGAAQSSNVVRNFLQTDYLLSACPFQTEMYTRSYKLEGLYRGKIIQEGAPRLDLLTGADREAVLSRLRRLGVEISPARKIILFAPTWRGTAFSQASADISFCYDLKRQLESKIDITKYQILVRLHQQVYQQVGRQLQDGFFIPADLDADEMLAVTDILISDYSSIFFDFLVTGRPVLFYIPDLDSYNRQRGIYGSLENLPGPYTDDAEQLGDWINGIDAVFPAYREKYTAARVWSNADGSGTVSRRIVDIVFNGREEGHCICQPRHAKERLLIHRGRMRVNGISTSLLSLLESIGYDRFDVTLALQPAGNANEARLTDRIPPQVRTLYRHFGNPLTVGERILQNYYSRWGYKNVWHPMFGRDARRCFGSAEFDHVVDFDGYGAYFAVLCLQFSGAGKCIWQHNDMQQEQNRRFPWLKQVFGLYRYFDRVVSCGYDVMTVNRQKLKSWCGPEKFGYMRNFIDTSRIRSSLGRAMIREFEGKSWFLYSRREAAGCVLLGLMPWIPPRNADGEANCRFITVGRTSVEKNHENLLRAFAQLLQQYPNVYLYLLGEGNLKEKTDRLIEELGLTERVFAPGNVDNPFAVMENCDCFILPSLHEGQPMVIHEARVLGMPIIVSDFSSVNGSLVENGQLVVGTDVESIRSGMEAFLHGRVPGDYAFDAEDYNRQAYWEFLKAIRALGPHS